MGLVTLGRAKQVPRERWPSTRVADVTDGDLERLIVPADAMVDRIVDRLGPEGSGAVLVVRDNRLVGILTRADIVRELQVAS
jgi:CBS domain-containing protein